MDANTYVDMFLTKGDEYILVIGFLVLFVLFWQLLKGSSVPLAGEAGPVMSRGRESWFSLLADRFYHQGHGWAMPEAAQYVRIGMDDFSQKLVGRCEKVELPDRGDHLEQGKVGWHMEIAGNRIPFLSPVEGEVVEVNNAVRKNPGLLLKDPYGEGWIAVVRPRHRKQVLSNLLTGALARAWMDQTVDAVREKVSPELGLIYQDGGIPIDGFVMHMSPSSWNKIVGEFFMTK